MTRLSLLAATLLLASRAAASTADPPSRIDYEAFAGLTKQAGDYRQSRLVGLEEFMRMATEPGTIILDARSESAYKRKHIRGAVHLSFSDFSYAGLARVIPEPTTRILIYCNNNITGDTENFPTKAMPLALNIPTFINLYGYGYRNVYELSSLLDADDPRLVFEGTHASAR